MSDYCAREMGNGKAYSQPTFNTLQTGKNGDLPSAVLWFNMDEALAKLYRGRWPQL